MEMFVDPPISTRHDRSVLAIVLNFILFWRLHDLLLAIKLIVLNVLAFLRLYELNHDREIAEYRRVLKTCKSYGEWLEAAKRLDVLEGGEIWKQFKASDYYDYELIEHRLKAMRAHTHNKDLDSMMLAHRAGLLRNLGGMGNHKLFTHSRVGTKYLINEYIDEVVRELNFICDYEGSDLSLEKKFDFFFETRQAFGRSALLLSGGATLGMYHFGVIKALADAKLLPRVISGSSVGSIVASVIAVVTDEEIPYLYEARAWKLNAFESLGPGSMKRKLNRLFSKGVLMDVNKLRSCVRENIGDVTFKEAYEKTKRICNITVASTANFEFPRLLNYLTAPNVLIWSAALASCALKFLFEPVELMAKNKDGKIVPYHPSGMKWSDGSVASDLPMDRLSELFNVNHFIVSQVNPHVLPFLSKNPENRSGLGNAIQFLVKSEIKHRVTQLATLGLVPNFLASVPPLITQKYVGDITIVPDVTFQDYKNLVSNPTPEMIVNCINKGMRTTWPKLPLIMNHCAIELTLERCTTKLKEQLYKKELVVRRLSLGLAPYEHPSEFIRANSPTKPLPLRSSGDRTSETHYTASEID